VFPLKFLSWLNVSTATWTRRLTLEVLYHLSQKIDRRENNLLDIFVAFIYLVVQMDNIILKDNNENRI